jgi:hypothetical protein
MCERFCSVDLEVQKRPDISAPTGTENSASFSLLGGQIGYRTGSVTRLIRALA